jgi:hypothetical protein
MPAHTTTLKGRILARVGFPIPRLYLVKLRCISETQRPAKCLESEKHRVFTVAATILTCCLDGRADLEKNRELIAGKSSSAVGIRYACSRRS